MMSKRLLVVVGSVAAMCAAVAASVLGTAVPAAAHGGGSAIEVTSSVPEATGTRFEVRVTHANDGDPIGAATVTAVVTDPAGVAGPPVALVYSDDGRYSALVPMPVGPSTVHFAVVEPEGDLDVEQTFAPPVTEAPTTAPTTTIAPDAPPAPVVTSGDAMSPTASPTPATDDDDDSGSLVLPVVGGFVLLAAVLAGALWQRRRAAPPE